MGRLYGGLQDGEGTCLDPLQVGLAGRLLTASRKAERLSGVGLPRPSPGGTACRRVPDRGVRVHFRKKKERIIRLVRRTSLS